MTSTQVRIAAVQCRLNGSVAQNVERVSHLVRQAAAEKAQVIVTPELLEGPYFCREEREEFFALAKPAHEHPTLAHFSQLAKQHAVVLPISFFERDGPHYYNSVAVFDADGSQLGIYRKSHIPDGPGYEEKFFFRPGNTGFCVWNTRFGCVGVGICWDQWFPECARAMVLMGAQMLLYPTAIGSEPTAPDLDTKDPWQRAMIGHAVSNVIPVAAANRVGDEGGQQFYGSSFIADERGTKVQEMGRDEEGYVMSQHDLAAIATHRAAFGFFRDRRTDLYRALLTP